MAYPSSIASSEDVLPQAAVVFEYRRYGGGGKNNGVIMGINEISMGNNMGYVHANNMGTHLYWSSGIFTGCEAVGESGAYPSQGGIMSPGKSWDSIHQKKNPQRFLRTFQRWVPYVLHSEAAGEVSFEDLVILGVTSWDMCHIVPPCQDEAT